MGTALANAVASGDRQAVLWSEDAAIVRSVNDSHRNPVHFTDHVLPRCLSATSNLREALTGAGCVLVAVPSEAVRATGARMRQHLDPDAAVISTVKALERVTNKRMSAVLQEETGVRDVGAISGPNLSHDILAGRPTGLVVGSANRAVIDEVAEALTGPALQVAGTSDLVGLELMGALKNVIAIGAGIASGLELGDNARALIIARGLMEIQTLSAALGGCHETFRSVAGIGDLFLTATSLHSRNHMVGIELGRGAGLSQIVALLGRLRETAEGIGTVEACCSLAASQRLRMPLAESVHAVMFEGRDPRAAILSALNDSADDFQPFPMPAQVGCDG
jgi:glycerol-3-phosphate dehydrogenase (NAD(P)+)